MFELLQPVKCLLSREPVIIDNIVFRLHSRVTVVILVTCSIIISAKQYVGEPISCITDASIDKEPVNAYCWIYSTFTVSRHLRGIPGRNVASPGVGPALENDEIHHHRYYQWVCFVLGLQAIIFYTPRALWGVWERGTVALLTRDLTSPFLRDVWSQERREQLVEYFASTHLHTHNFYALCYLFCEALNFLNVIAQIYLLDAFLEGQFTRYGPAVAAFGMETKPFERVDPMSRLFPKVTKCTIHTFGSSGSQQTHDALCVLPLNVVNEKTFVFVWFWLVFLACIGSLNLLYRIILFAHYKTRIYILRANTRILTNAQVEAVVGGLNFGDWFLLHQLAQNVNPIVYRELVSELATKFSYKYYPTVV
ncbi:innexin inx2-like [Diachasma alloeum]|uniref:innexin inx2-like n=1 Tax=Diachasma alloeum TaxID=454923 RepID=UPI0007383697|nr:innexin inx2-like [Diachasma alloeum]